MSRWGMPQFSSATPALAILSYAEEARLGSGRMVAVSGEAGIGKSTLVERLATTVPAARWWWGACDGLSTPRPLGPLIDVAAQVGDDCVSAAIPAPPAMYCSTPCCGSCRPVRT